MKDIVRLEAASLSSNASARLYVPHPVSIHPESIDPRKDIKNDRVSVSPAAQSLNQQAVTVREPTSASKLASLQDRILADSLDIDYPGIAEHMLRDLSRE